MGRCKICCADEMIVGRWYKLITHAVGHGVPYNYTVNYSTEAENVVLLHDTVYIKETGAFTVSCVDQYGNKDTKTITAIEKPSIERTEYTITPTSWSDFQAQVTAIGENALIHVTKGEYAFELTESSYILPAGTVIDFGGSTINVTSAVTTYGGLKIYYDFCGIKNGKFVGNMLNDESYVNASTFISVISGKYAEVENLTFDGMAGFNLTVGAWPSYWSFQPYYKNSRWDDSVNYNGYIADDGSLTASAEAWTMTEAAEIITTPDRSYYVGRSNMNIPSYVRLFDIAFYDADMKLLELKKDCQYYRAYYYPENAAYVRYCIWQEEEPVNAQPRDDVCIMRMFGGDDTVQTALSVDEAYIANIAYKNHASGGISITGKCEELHIDRMLAKDNGWSNHWAFDAEDGWNSMLGVVVTHSYFAMGDVVLHGCQGVSMISCICGSVSFKSTVHFPTIINSLMHTVYGYSLRGCGTIINSYYYRKEDSEGYGSVYTFGDRTVEENKAMRNQMAKHIY